MPLIKCSECGGDVSDKASSCPRCGNLINPANSLDVKISSFPNQPLKIEPELTSKNWKKVKLTAWLIIIGGLMSISFFAQSTPDGQWVGFGITLLGAIVLIIGKIGAWYADKRTR